LAERRAKGEDELAARLEDKGQPDLASKHREAAAWWRRVGNIPEPKATETRLECQRGALFAIDSLLARAEAGDTASLPPLLRIATQLLGGLHTLAKGGDELALTVWGEVLQYSALDFKALGKSHPEIMEQWARHQPFIPGLISRIKALNDSNDELLKTLHVGENHPMPVVKRDGPGAPLDLYGPAWHWAMRIHLSLSQQRHELLGSPDHRNLSEQDAKIARLPDFDKSTWQSWADVAWKIVLEVTAGNPQDHPELKPLGESAAKRETYKGTKTTSYSKAKIKERLRQAFKLMAAK
jgi:hypothetical protein